MPEHKNDLPDDFTRVKDQVTGDVAEAILIHPRSCGQLHMPGEWSTDNRAPAHKIEITTTDPDNKSADIEETHFGTLRHYLLRYNV